MKSPTLPAPAIATRISVSVSLLEPVAQRVERVTRRTTKCRMSPSWPIALGRAITCALPRRVIATSQNTPGSLSGASFLPAHAAGDRVVDAGTPCRWGRSTRAAAPRSGSSRRITWSVVHETVATVGMPSRW